MDLIEEIVKGYGGVEAAQKALGYTNEQWMRDWRNRGIPAKHHLKLHTEMGIPVDRLKSLPKRLPS